MSLISENDKKTWQNYIENFKNFNISFSDNEKSIVNKSKKKIYNKTVSSNHFKLIRQGKVKPDGVLDLHGYKLEDAKKALQKYMINAYEENVRNILVITGKGQNNKGVLKKEVPLWFNEKILSNILVKYRQMTQKVHICHFATI